MSHNTCHVTHVTCVTFCITSVLLGDVNLLLPPADATETKSAVVQEAKSPESPESGDFAGKINTVCVEIVFDFVFVSS